MRLLVSFAEVTVIANVAIVNPALCSPLSQLTVDGTVLRRINTTFDDNKQSEQ